MALCPLILNFLHISKMAFFANYFGLPNFLPQVANLFTRIYPSNPWHFPTLLSTFVLWLDFEYGCFQSPGKRKGGASASKLFHLGQLLKRLVVTMWVKKTTISSRFLNVCKEVGWLYWEMWKCIVKLLNFQFLPYLHFSETAGKIQSRTWEIERKSNWGQTI